MGSQQFVVPSPFPPALSQVLSIMNLRMLWAATVALSMTIPRLPGVWAQLGSVSAVASCSADWVWSENSLQQDPCRIASLLDATCRSISDFGVPPLQRGQSYAPPSSGFQNNLVCDCDTVMYSLYMACSACQSGFTYPWTRWIAQCNSSSIARYTHDIPDGTAIPRWALYNVTILPNQTYNIAVAMAIGRDPEMPPTPPAVVGSDNSTKSSSTGFAASAQVTSRDPASVPAPSSTTGNSGKNKTGVIIGAVVGSLAPLIILSAIAGYCLGQRKRREKPEEMFYKGDSAAPALLSNGLGTSYFTHNGHGQNGHVSGYDYVPELS